VSGHHTWIGAAVLAALWLGAWPALAIAPGPEEAYETARKLQIQALKRDRSEAWRKAADAFYDVLSRYPDHRQALEARFGYAECLLAAGDLDEAWDAYQELRRVGGGRRWGDLISGEAFVLLARVEQGAPGEFAEQFLERVQLLRREDSGHDRLPLLLVAAGGVHRSAGELELAEKALLALVDDWPTDPAAERGWEDLGSIRLLLDDHHGAVRAYRGYLDHFPEGARANEVRCVLAFAYLQRGDERGAASTAQYVLERLDPERKDDDLRLWNETIKIVAAVEAPEVEDIRTLRHRLDHPDHAWNLDVLIATLTIHAAEGRSAHALEGLELLEERDLLELKSAARGVRSQLVDCCLALREARPGDAEVQRWLLVAADAMDSLERQGEAGELLQWLRNSSDHPAIRREARERQLRGG
jgi:tetratricopeptide (TPR) repeat protein